MIDGDYEVYDIDDPQVPDELREHARQFRTPTRFVIVVGSDEYAMMAEDGEFIDVAVFDD